MKSAGSPQGTGLRVAMATPEMAPFARTGGLSDVLASLPKALGRLEVKVSVILPAYRSVLRGGFPLEDTGVRLRVPVAQREEEAALLRTGAGQATSVYFVRADKYFDRDQLYGTADGDYADNGERFVFFSRAVLEVLKLDPPHVLHGHDWQAALAIVFLKAQPQRYPELATARTVLTVHNPGYQGLVSAQDWGLLGLEAAYFTPRYLEYYGQVNFLKGGAVFADAIATVSPSYAEEIKTPERGFGLDGVFRERARDLVGILNGADYQVWDPRADSFIARNYGPEDLEGKRACKAALQQAFGLAEGPETPLVGMVTRLAAQKGMDLVQAALPGLLDRGAQLALLGTGDRVFEESFRLLPSRHPGKVGVIIGFDDALAHKVIAGADLLLMPSRYEPAGLGQVYSLKYGTIPIVRATGGLKDTVQEFDPTERRGNGFLFGPYEASALLQAVDRALALFQRKDQWAVLMRNAMAADFSWDRPSRAYLDLYRRLLAGQSPG